MRSQLKPKRGSEYHISSKKNHKIFCLVFFIFNHPIHPLRKEDVKEADSEKEAAMEAELRAARERAIVPLEARMTQFREMLLERGVTLALC